MTLAPASGLRGKATQFEASVTVNPLDWAASPEQKDIRSPQPCEAPQRHWRVRAARTRNLTLDRRPRAL
ncbi:MAG TPA: hypothetical protein PLJ87_01835, partial [Anaerolineaceae bacterium]|nr:hypothetical protein [Anaerolineaceae bacterium]